MKYRLGTRKSELALKQSQLVQELLKKKGCDTELVLIESEGDQKINVPLYQIENSSPGLFTKQLEKALLEGQIDLAVHSLKDLPTTQPPDLHLAAITQRESAFDCLIQRRDEFDPSKVLGLKAGAQVGTSSLRRQALLAACRPDLKIVSLRGNVPTRLEAVRAQKLDAIVLAEAGLNRLGVKLEGLRKETLPLNQFVPAPGQGALAVEVRLDCSPQLLSAIKSVHDSLTARAVVVEREVLRQLEGGCTLPLGVYCAWKDKHMILNAFLGLSDSAPGSAMVWKDFKRFDIESPLEQTLISQTVNFFRGDSHAGS